MKKLLLLALLLAPATASAEIKTKTIEYALYQSTPLTTTGVTRSFQNITVYIPETVGRRFRSVYTVTGGLDANAAATNVTAQTTALSIDAVAFSTVTFTDTVTNSGENQSWVWLSSFTQYFHTNFTGTSHTLRCNTVTTGPSSNNVSVKLIITYDYDDSATTQIKTVRIPIHSSSSSITQTLTEIGTNQVPALDTFLPELSKVYRDIFFEIHTNEGTTAASAVNPTLSLALDAEAGLADDPHEDALVSARHYYRIWKRPEINTAVTHQFKAATSNNSQPYPALGAILTVTYEFNAVTSTGIINSIMVAAGHDEGYAGNSTAANQSRYRKEITIPEPGPITLRKSGIKLHTIDAGVITMGVGAGEQSHSTYTFAATVNCGAKTLIHNIDTNSGFTINRGTNPLTVNWYTQSGTTGNMGSMTSALAYINYVSSKTTQGGGVSNHQQTLLYLGEPANNDATLDGLGLEAPPSLRSLGHWISNLWYQLLVAIPSTVSASSSFTLAAEIMPGENGGDGWQPLGSSLYANDAEWSPMFAHYDATSLFKRYPSDPRTNLMILSSTRGYRAHGSVATYYQTTLGVTVHTTTVTITGSITDYSGDGSGIAVDIYYSDTEELVGTTTSVTGGTFSLVWYSDARPVYAVAYQDATRSGRSAAVTPGTTAADIDLQSGTGGGGGGSFTFVQ